jgi:hypothetical protein
MGGWVRFRAGLDALEKIQALIYGVTSTSFGRGGQSTKYKTAECSTIATHFRNGQK